jgi:hypothetical protein
MAREAKLDTQCRGPLKRIGGNPFFLEESV